ncbi:toxin-activating lysine-acyltransferase [Frigidibacter sp. SD6-1]|uniref:toxin-activating lysine-acyltransferase n=1 Tax=Frigidibacter sp. SD6-1 TaxID=3032581 RepID=UPI0024E0078C|nr:toxin-activating lysine-acyltransferase [Frigidibacter sp. SD6-1]
MSKTKETTAPQTSDAVNGTAAPALSPEVLAKIQELRTQVRESFGQVVMAVMNLPRYRHQSLGDLAQMVLEPLIRDRIAIARPAKEEPGTLSDIAGFAIWASVSEEADAKIRDQIKSATFPIRLKPEDWQSGSINWLLDVIAPDRKTAGRVIANFRQVVKEGELRMHPHVVGLIEKEMLEKITANAAKLKESAKTD